MDLQAFIARDDITCVRLRGATRAESRTPVHFCVVCDISGSMDIDNKLENVKRSLEYIVTILTKDDYMSIITFSDSAHVLINRSPVTETNMIRIQQAIKGIRTEGSTNLGDALLKTNDCLSNEGFAGVKQGVLVLTDGQANAGIKDTDGLMGILNAITTGHSGVTFSCVGYGTDHNGPLLNALSTQGGGSYNLVENMEDVANVFGDILGGLASCTHKNIIVEIPEGCEQVTQLPMEGQKIQVGDLRAEMDVTLLLKNCPVEKEIRVTGYDIQAKAFIDQTIKVITTGDNILLLHGVITILRTAVVGIMERIRQGIQNRTLDAHREELRTEIRRQREAIQLQITIGGENPVLGMLLEELTTCETTLNTQINSAHLYEHATQILSQHVSHVGLGRGIRHNATPGRPQDISAPSPYANIFSNDLQRRVSEGIRSATVTISNPMPSGNPSDIMTQDEVYTQLMDALDDPATPTEAENGND